MSKRILIVGNYNSYNYGDDLLLEACVKNIKSKNIKVLSCINSDYVTFPSGIRSLFELRRYSDPFRAIIWSEKVLFGGGGLFNSDRLQSLFIWMPILILSLLLKKKVYIFGHSFSSRPGFILAYILKKVDKITVRDNRSYEYLKDAKIESSLTCDLFLESTNVVFKKLSKPNLVVLNFRTYNKIDTQKISLLNSVLVEKAKSEHLKPVYVYFCKSDKLLYEKLGLGPIYSPNQIRNKLQNVKCAINMRLHANLFFIKNQVPTFVISYASKVIGLMNTYKYSQVFEFDNDLFSKLDRISLMDIKSVSIKNTKRNPWNLLN